MQVVFDHPGFAWQQHGGKSRQFCEVAERLAGYEGCEVTVLALEYVNESLAKPPFSWDGCARGTYDVYRAATRGRR